jgi:hypothetical protein
MDEKTSSMLKEMIEYITNELKSVDMKGPNAMENLMKVAQTVSEKVVPKLKESGLDFNKIMASAQKMASKCVDKDGKPIFGDMQNGNPMEMITKMMSTMGGVGGQEGNNNPMAMISKMMATMGGNNTGDGGQVNPMAMISKMMATMGGNNTGDGGQVNPMAMLSQMMGQMNQTGNSEGNSGENIDLNNTDNVD